MTAPICSVRLSCEMQDLSPQADLFAAHGYKKYCPSFLPRIPDGRDITGRPWQGCHNSAASFYSCAAGFPLKSVGGREKVSLAPALSLRPACHTGSKAPLIALAACLFTSFKLPSSRRALCRYSRGFRTCNTVYSVFNDLKVTRNSVSF